MHFEKRGRGFRAAVAAVALAVAAAATAAEPGAGEPANVEVEASLAVMSRYVFRGWAYGAAHGVVQPEVTVSRAGLSAGAWANLDLGEEATSAFEPDRPGEASLNELDLTAGYERAFGPVTLGAGYAAYRTRFAPHTQEVSMHVALDLPGEPTLEVARDVDAFPSTYASLALSQAIPLSPRATLRLDAHAGYLAGEGSAWTPVRADGSRGRAYRALHDGAVGAALDLALGAVTVSPSARFTFPLSDEAARTGADPAGALRPLLVVGTSLTASF